MLFFQKKFFMFQKNRIMKIIKPKVLKKGDLIGILAPASPPINRKSVYRSIKYLESLGYRVKLGEHIFDKSGYLAGSDLDRAKEINNFFADKKIKAIFSLRGGYGSQRILPLLDYHTIKNNPKIFVGYSDITSIQLAIYKKCRMITFAGPMIESDFSKGYDSHVEELFWKLITSTHAIGDILQYVRKKPDNKYGNIEGQIVGGNLSIITSLVGTEFLPRLDNHILLIEDIDERPYRIDRMLHQIKFSNNIKNLKCVVIGDFSSCKENKNKPTLSLDEIFHNIFQGIPVIKNFQFGHIKESLPIPYGIRVKITKNRFEFIESAVVP